MALAYRGSAVAEKAPCFDTQKKVLSNGGEMHKCSTRIRVQCQAGGACAVIAKLRAVREDRFLSSGELGRTSVCPRQFPGGQCVQIGDGRGRRCCSPKIRRRATEIAAPDVVTDGAAEGRALEPLEDQAGGGMQNLGSVAGSYDVVILTNGPGEVAAWVKPVVKALRRRFGEDRGRLRISVVLSPCPHASQQEAALVRSFPEVDRCQEAQHFSSLLVWGQTAEGWDWRQNGVSLFLGGDQFNALILGWRLGYKTVLYAEESVRWAWLADMYFLRNSCLLTGVPSSAQKRCEVVGDLFVDAVSEDRKATFGEPVSASNLSTPKGNSNTNRRSQANVDQASAGFNGRTNGAATLVLDAAVPETRDFSTEDADRVRSHAEAGPRAHPEGQFTVGILPGSKPAKLGLGVPYFLAAVDRIRAESSDVRFVLPLAPTVSLEELAAQASPDRNPNIHHFGWTSANLEPRASSDSSRFRPDPSGAPVAILTTRGGARVEVYHHFPAYDVFRECDVCLTTIGTNTAELGSLGVPMIVVLPTHSLEVFRGATGGIGGFLANLPGPIGDVAARVVNGALLKSAGFIAWPNRWAKEAVVPELIGRIEPDEVAAVVLDHMRDPAKLQSMKERLQSLNQGSAGEAADGEGAAERIAHSIQDLLETRS